MLTKLSSFKEKIVLDDTVHLIFFEGLSVASHLIRWFTRSKFSHVGFYFTPSVPTSPPILVEAWSDTNSSRFGIFGASWRFNILYNHTPKTPFKVLSKGVDSETYERYLEVVNFVANARIPYDWLEITKFVIPFKELKPNGRFVCSTGTCFILQYVGLLPPEIPYYRQAPQDVYELALTAGFKLTQEGIVP